jgi:hypothetical protein
MLRDAGVMDTRFGSYISAIGTVGEFGAHRGRRPPPDQQGARPHLAAAGGVHRGGGGHRPAGRPDPAAGWWLMLNRHLESSAQLPVRVSLLLIVLLVLLAETSGLDVLLGAFAAGIVVRLFSAGGEIEAIRGEVGGDRVRVPHPHLLRGERDRVRPAHVFVHHPESLWRVPLFLLSDAGGPGYPVYLLYRGRLNAIRADADGVVLGHRAAPHRGDHQHRPLRAQDARGERGVAGGGGHVVGDAVPRRRACGGSARTGDGAGGTQDATTDGAGLSIAFRDQGMPATPSGVSSLGR